MTDLLTAKKYKGMTLGETYVSRDGSMFRHVTSGSTWSAPMVVVKNNGPKDVNLGAEVCLLYGNGPDYKNPLTWTGGAFCSGWDIIGVYKPTREKPEPVPTVQTAWAIAFKDTGKLESDFLFTNRGSAREWIKGSPNFKVVKVELKIIG